MTPQFIALITYVHRYKYICCDAFARILGDLAGVGLEFARKDLEEGRLAGAVRADDSVAVAALEREVHFLEENAATVLKTDI